MSTKVEFNHRLEALRGLAALSVAIHHSIYFFNYHPHSARFIHAIEAIFYGHGAVLCFFVLSGYVLGQSLSRNTTFNFSSYVVFAFRRCLRILPAFIAAVLLIFAIYCFTDLWRTQSPAASSDYITKYDFPKTPDILVRNLLFQQFQINPVAWTLVPELICSFLLPSLYLVSRKRTVFKIALLITLLGLYAATAGSDSMFIRSFSYTWIFYLGFLLSTQVPILHRFMRLSPLLFPALLGAAGVTCLLVPHFGHNEIVFVVGVSVIIKLIIDFPQSKYFAVLDLPPVRFLGKVSYSFYLLHFPTAFAFASAALARVPASTLVDHTALTGFVIAGVSTTMALPLAALFYFIIEKPFIGLGKRLFVKTNLQPTLSKI